MNLREFVNRFRRDPWIGRWLPAGIFGGIAGGFATAWLLWGFPRLLSRSLCILVKIPPAVLMLAFVTTFGCTFILMTQTLIRGLRQLFRPPMSMYEPMEPMPELELVEWPHPGCGLAFMVPIILLSAVLSVPWLWFGPRQVSFGRLLISALLALPLGLAIARKEVEQSYNPPDLTDYYR